MCILCRRYSSLPYTASNIEQSSKFIINGNNTVLYKSTIKLTRNTTNSIVHKKLIMKLTLNYKWQIKYCIIYIVYIVKQDMCSVFTIGWCRSNMFGVVHVQFVLHYFEVQY